MVMTMTRRRLTTLLHMLISFFDNYYLISHFQVDYIVLIPFGIAKE